MSLIGQPVNINGKNSSKFTIRDATADDAAQLISLLKSVAAEEIYTLTSADEFPSSIAEEISWINFHRENDGNLLIVAEIDTTVVGVCNFASREKKRVQHTGSLAIGIAAEYRNQGIGTALLSILLKWASSYKKLEKVNLAVRSDNERAIFLYQKLGFVQEGILKRDLKYPSGEYADSILMAHFLGTLT